MQESKGIVTGAWYKEMTTFPSSMEPFFFNIFKLKLLG